MAAFKDVYSGSKSMRWAVLTVFKAFCGGGAIILLSCLRDKEDGWAVVIESERLRAAGSMSGMAKAGGDPVGCASYFQGRRRPIEVLGGPGYSRKFPRCCKQSPRRLTISPPGLLDSIAGRGGADESGRLSNKKRSLVADRRALSAKA